MTNQKSEIIRVKTGEVRASYAHRLFKAKKNDKSGKDEFTCMFLIAKEDKQTLRDISSAIKNACLAAFDTDDLAELGIKNPLRDCAKDKKRKDDPTYEGYYFINARSYKPPRVAQYINGALVDLQSTEEFKSGDFCKASLTFKAYAVHGTLGVYVNGVLKTRDGEPLGDSYSMEDDFAEEAETYNTATQQEDDDFLDIPQ